MASSCPTRRGATPSHVRRPRYERPADQPGDRPGDRTSDRTSDRSRRNPAGRMGRARRARSWLTPSPASPTCSSRYCRPSRSTLRRSTRTSLRPALAPVGLPASRPALPHRMVPPTPPLGAFGARPMAYVRHDAAAGRHALHPGGEVTGAQQLRADADDVRGLHTRR
jgi:hypothetical protein